jgi:hypothetical protein
MVDNNGTSGVGGRVEVATIIFKEEAGKYGTGCQVCSRQLVDEHGGESNLRYKLCLEHLTLALGENRQEAMAMLLARGVIMICYYSANQAFKVRVEVRSTKRSELAILEKQFGLGRIYRHQGTLLRWSCASLADLHKMGSILIPVIPEFGIFLQGYVIQPDKATRSAYAEAFMQKMGQRTTHLISHM